MSSCKICHLAEKKHSKKLWILHQQAQLCALCQMNASEHSEKLWEMHKLAVEQGQFCPFHKKKEKLYPITVGTARASIARVCKLNADPPFDIDFVPIHMHCSNPNCNLYLSYIEEDRADVLDGLCLKCFRELDDVSHKPLKEVYEPNKVKPVLNVWSGEIVDWDPFEQTDSSKITTKKGVTD